MIMDWLSSRYNIRQMDGHPCRKCGGVTSDRSNRVDCDIVVKGKYVRDGMDWDPYCRTVTFHIDCWKKEIRKHAIQVS